ncbi:MAG TPA: metallophosphoesterase [Anaerolineae bacterium]|nr:metallophosphoesterase [Anaerolineae bacterium]
MRYALLSDIHANLAALEAVLAHLDVETVDEIWCLGDVVGYGPDPNECIERLQELPHRCLAGNHDWAVLGRLALEDFNADAQRACLWTREQLTPASLRYLESLEERIVEGDFTLVHGSPRHPIWEYIIYLSNARANFAHFDTPYCFIGHTHVPVIFRDRGSEVDIRPIELGVPLALGQERLIINPGSVGQPRDGDFRASYVILDVEAGTIEYRRVPYPVEETQRKMAQAGLPPRLIIRLSYGW